MEHTLQCHTFSPEMMKNATSLNNTLLVQFRVCSSGADYDGSNDDGWRPKVSSIPLEHRTYTHGRSSIYTKGHYYCWQNIYGKGPEDIQSVSFPYTPSSVYACCCNHIYRRKGPYVCVCVYIRMTGIVAPISSTDQTNPGTLKDFILFSSPFLYFKCLH